MGNPLDLARPWDCLARTYLGLGQAGKAEPLFNKALATRIAELGVKDILTLRTRTGLAQAFHVGGKVRESIELLEQVKEAQERTLGADHLETLATLSELGWVYGLEGNAAKAVAVLEQARDGKLKQLGDDHPDTLSTLENLIVAYAADRKHGEPSRSPKRPMLLD